MKVLLTGGKSGQLWSELHRTRPEQIELVDAGKERLDITDSERLASVVRELNPDVIINAAAYTAVDKAESESAEAYAVNEQGVINLCEAAAAVSARLLHVSTDFVFGPGNGSPFLTTSETAPVSIYGKSKLAGELQIQRLLPEQSLIVRTAWVYSSFGNNFVKTMLRLMGERSELGVIADQVGSPTWAKPLATAIWRAQEQKSSGIMHWTGAGVASWYDFAQAIFEESTELGLLTKPVDIKPLRTDQYPTPAARPAYSVMETSVTREQLE